MTTSQPNDYFLEAYRHYQEQNPKRKKANTLAEASHLSSVNRMPPPLTS